MCVTVLTNEGVWDGDFEPHAVADLETRVRVGHRLDNRGHVRVDGQVQIVKPCTQRGR